MFVCVGECNMIKTIDCDNIKVNLAVTIGIGKVQFSESRFFKTHVFRFNYFAWTNSKYMCAV